MPNTAARIQELEIKCSLQEQEIDELKTRLQFYEEQIRLSQARRFGPKSEAGAGQINIFNEVELENNPKAPEPTIEVATHKRRQSRGKNKIDLDELPTETLEYKLPSEELTCCTCGGEMHEMSTEVRCELHMLPVQFKQVKHVRSVYGCRQCEQTGTKAKIVTAPMPEPAFPGSIASPSLVAHIISQKYVEAMPLYRQEKAFERQGIEISRQNMANWVVKGAENWLSPIYDSLKTELVKQDILHADETVLQVLNEPGRAATTKSYMWLYLTGRDGPPIVLYDYRTTRANKHPQNFLADFNGYLHVDGYSGYNNLTGVTLIGCWAHARRKFDEALKVLPPEKKDSDVPAKEGLDYINRLFKLEREMKELTADERHRLRQKKSRPLVVQFYEWLAYQRPRVLPKSAFGEAIGYCINQREKLEGFLLDGRLELDNNRAERSIKPFVIGRKNFLFSNTPRGAKSSAVIYSIVETAKEHGLNPFHYIKYLFEQVPNIDHSDSEAFEKVLPWSKTLPQECFGGRQEN